MIFWHFLLPLTALALNRLTDKSRSQPFVQIPIYNDHNLMNYVKINLDASAASTKNVLLDTGSNDVWVYMDKNHLEDWVQEANNKNTSEIVDTLIAQGREKFEINYQSGRVRGIMNPRDVEIGNCIIEDARVGTVFRDSATSGVFGHSAIEGIIGLGLRGVSYKGFPSPFQEISNAGCVKDNVFSLLLPNDDLKEGSLVLGGVNKRYIRDGLKFYPVTGEKYWETEFTAIKIAGKSVLDCRKTPCKAIFDSGTTSIGGPSRVINRLIVSIEKADRANPKLLPNITFTFGDTDYDIGPEDYLLDVSEAMSANEEQVELTASGKKVALMPVDLSFDEKKFILGAVFMKKYVTVYDGANLEVGIGKKNMAWRDSEDDFRLISEMRSGSNTEPWYQVYGN